MAWGLVNVEDGGGVGPIPGDVPKVVSDHLINTDIHVTAELKNKINGAITSKDIVMQLNGPLEIGAQKETEMLFPYKGTVDKIYVELSENSFPESNLLVSIQENKNGNWVGLDTINVGIDSRITTHDTSFALNNSILRIVLLEGDYPKVELLNIVLVVKDIIPI